MATVKKIEYESGKKTWQVRWREDGKQRMKNFDRAKDANDFKVSIEASQRDGTYVSPSKILVSEYFEKWLSYKKSSLSDKTYSSYESTTAAMGEIIGKIQLQKLTVTDIESLYNDLHADGLGGTSCNYYHRILKQSLKQALKDRLIQFNPADLARPISKDKFKAEIIHPDMVKTFLSYFSGAEIETAVNLSLFLGLRRAEVCGLQWQDINFKTRVITVRRTLHYKEGKYFHRSTKSKQTRQIPFTLGVAKKLKAEIKDQAKYRKHFGESYVKNKYICVHRNGMQFIPEYVSHSYTNIKGPAFENIRFHDLRHTAATLMLYHGADIKTVSDILGHSSITITGDIYLHALDDLKRTAIDALDQYLETSDKIVQFKRSV
ncbi:MAG: site-specific integrase [Acetobacterium woodii]|nr:site-specific integrase [Acetobacterium woodii]